MLAQKDVNNLEVHFLRLEQAANNQDLAALEEALKDVKKVEGEGALWLFGQARLLAVRAAKENNPGLLDEALQYLAKARDLRPSWPRIPLFMGTIYDQQNKPDQALKHYMDAIDLGERNPAALRRTVQILFQKQRYADADKLLQQLDRQQVPFTPELTRLWVQLLFHQGEFDLAVAKARQVVSEKSDDYKEQLWLGQILGIAARRAKA
ncbi:MAG: tetratricopeptide repeat protein, partial [Thermoguttaceae bacterium]